MVLSGENPSGHQTSGQEGKSRIEYAVTKLDDIATAAGSGQETYLCEHLLDELPVRLVVKLLVE